MALSDFNKYVGIPWKWQGEDFTGCDCWTFCCLVWRNIFELTPPKIMYSLKWQQVFNTQYLKYFYTVNVPEAGDLCVMSTQPERPHFGIYINRAVFLQCIFQVGSVSTKFKKFQKFIKVIGRPRFK